MLTIAPLARSGKLPLRIDISWMKSLAFTERPAIVETKPQAEETNASERFALIQRILELSPTAPTDFLARFEIADLQSYLRHLQVAALPRGRNARWIRPDNTPGIAMSEPAA
jgi:hypothetical protein